MTIKELITKKDVFVIGLLFVVMILLSFIVYKDVPVLQERFVPCLEYLGEGTLYQGQPRCIQGPIFFSATFLLNKVFGSMFEPLLVILNVLLHTLVFLIITAITKKITKNSPTWLLAILYATLVFIPTSNHLSAFYASVLFLIGFYTLFFKETRNKEIVVGIFFGLSLLTKAVTTVPIIASLIVYYLQGLSYKEGLRVFFKDFIKKYKTIFILMGPILLLFVFFELIFPGMLAYNYFILTINQETSLSGTLSSLGEFLMNPITNEELPKTVSGVIGRLGTISTGWMVILGSLLMGIVVFMKRKNKITGIFIISTVVMLFSIFKLSGQDIVRHLLPLNMLFVVVSMYAYNLFKNRNDITNKVLFFLSFFIILLMSFSFYHMVPHGGDKEFDELFKEIVYPMNFVPWENARVLSNKDLDTMGLELKNVEQTLIPKPLESKYRVDSAQAERLEQLELLTEEWKDWEKFGYEGYGEILKNMMQGNYDIIHIASSFDNSFIARAITSFEQELTAVGGEDIIKALKVQCRISFLAPHEKSPTSLHLSYIYLTNQQDCQETLSKLRQYYNNEFFDRICEQDYVMAYFIATHSEYTGEKTSCENGESILMKYYGTGFISTYGELYLYIVLLAGLIAVSLVKEKNGHE